MILGRGSCFRKHKTRRALEIPEKAKKYLSYNLETALVGKSDQWFSLVS
jgi:hypothetical protein